MQRDTANRLTSHATFEHFGELLLTGQPFLRLQGGTSQQRGGGESYGDFTHYFPPLPINPQRLGNHL
jgi:hypothetical protein